jgi:hypothetical protein
VNAGHNRDAYARARPARREAPPPKTPKHRHSPTSLDSTAQSEEGTVRRRCSQARTLGFRWLSLAFVGFLRPAPWLLLSFPGGPAWLFLAFRACHLGFCWLSRDEPRAFARAGLARSMSATPGPTSTLAARAGAAAHRCRQTDTMHMSKQRRPPRAHAARRRAAGPHVGPAAWLEHYVNYVKTTFACG